MRAKLTVLPVLVLLAGCGGDGSSSRPSGLQPLQPVISSRVTVVGGADADDAIVEPDRLLFPRAGHDALLARKPGDILVGRRQSTLGGKNPYGFLRKVESVAQSGDQIIVSTSHATLEDAIEQGEASLVQSVELPSRFDGSAVAPNASHPFPGLTAQGGGGLAGGELDVSGKLLDGMIGGGLTVSVSRGKFAFDPDVDFGIQIKSFKVQEFHAIVSGDLAVELALTLESSLSTSKTWEGEFFKVSHPLPPLMIGPVPVEVTMEFTVSGGAEVEVAGAQSVEAGAGVKSGVKLGGRYQRGVGWSKVSESAFDLYPIGPNIEDKVELSLKGFVPKVAITFLLYDTVGPGIEVDPYAKLTVRANQPCPWNLSAGVEGLFSAKAQIPVIGYTLAETDINLFDENAEIASGNLPAWLCGEGDAGADAGHDAAAGSGGSSGSGGAGNGGSGGAAGTGGTGGAPSNTTCGMLAAKNGWSNIYCENDNNGACKGHGPSTSDCDHCCTGQSCTQVVAQNGWTSMRCENAGNGVCGGAGVPTWDCDVCCGSTCNVDADCGGNVCAWNGLGYCCRAPGTDGNTCFTDAECTKPQVCTWNGTKFVCAEPLCSDTQP